MTAIGTRLGSDRKWELPLWLGMAVFSALLVVVTGRAGPAAVAGSGAVLLVVAVLFTTRHTGQALVLVLLYLGLADGYVKLRTGVAATTLIRDVLLYAVVLGVVLRASVRGIRLETPPLAGWVVAVVAVVSVQLANPGIVSVGGAFAGVRPHLEFVPLFFLAYWTVRDSRALRTFLVLLLSIGAINGAVSYVQSTMTPQQLATWGPGFRDQVLGEGKFARAARTYYDDQGGEQVRPPGLGGDLGFAGRLGILAIPAGLALLGLASRPRLRVLAIALLMLTVLGVMTAQTRGGFVASVAAVVAYAALASVSRRWWATVFSIVIGVVVAIAMVSLLAAKSDTGVFDRYESVAPSQILKTTGRERSLTKTREYLAEYPLGAGIGRSGPAASFNGVSFALDAETEFTYLTTEVGIPGLLAFLGLYLVLIALVATRCRRIRKSEARSMIAAIGAPLIAMLPLWFVTTTTAATPLSPFLWFAAGVLAFWLVTVPRYALDP